MKGEAPPYLCSIREVEEVNEVIRDVLPSRLPSNKTINNECELMPENKNPTKVPRKVFSKELIELSEV